MKVDCEMKASALVVDDEPAILLTIKAVLEMSNFVVETAASAFEAKQKLNSEVFDIVITDMKMETGTAGLEVVRAASGAPGEPAIAILTADRDFEPDWKRQGADDLLIKPMNADQFLARVAELLIQRDHNELSHMGWTNRSHARQLKPPSVLSRSGIVDLHSVAGRRLLYQSRN